MEPMPKQEIEGTPEAPADDLTLIWGELPAEKRREALQSLAQLLVKRAGEGGQKDEQPV